MAQKRRIPDRRPVLEACYRAVIHTAREHVGSARGALFVGGKSMGGRIASHVATDPGLGLAGLVLLGYPLHPPGRPAERRDAHLPAIACPVLVAQGSRDAFGTPPEIEPAFARTPHTTIHIVAGGDHSFKVGRSGAPGQAAVMDDVQRTIAGWMCRLPRE
jgi:predicted alpha/beta-hydrolase family hydrolase